MGSLFWFVIVGSSLFVLIALMLVSFILAVKGVFVSHEQCLIQINHNPELTKKTFTGQSLLEALAQQGIALPSPCGGKATCKQCKIRILKGGGDLLETDRSTFTLPELKKGWRLSCQCKVKGDLDIEIPESLLEQKIDQAIVISNCHIATFIKELTIEVKEKINYRPGEYFQFHVPSYQTCSMAWKKDMNEHISATWGKFGLFHHTINFKEEENEVVRAYSMASYPAEGKKLKFNVRIALPPLKKGKISTSIPWGIASSYLFSLNPQDQVKISGPFGSSHMIDDERELIFLIGGAGSSFARSHILDLFKTKHTKRQTTLWYGARSLCENIYQEEYEALAKEFDHFKYHLVLSEPTEEDINQGWPLDDPIRTNHVFKAFEQGQLKKMEEPENCLYYVCGPPLHNQSVLKLLDDYGVLKDSIVLDDFGS